MPHNRLPVLDCLLQLEHFFVQRSGIGLGGDQIREGREKEKRKGRREREQQ